MVGGYKVIVHQAALVSVARSVEDPLRVNQVNVAGTLNLLRAATEAGVERFVYASSSSVYGDTETLPKRESMGTVPSSPYGASKLAAENYCRVFAKVYRPEDRLAEILQRLRPSPKRRLLQRGDPDVHQESARRESPDHIRRRPADAGLHLRPGRRRGQLPRADEPPGQGRRGVQHRGGRDDLNQRTRTRPSPGCSASRTSPPSTRSQGRGTSGRATLTSRRPERSWDTGPDSPSRKGLADTIEWFAQEGEAEQGPSARSPER